MTTFLSERLLWCEVPLFAFRYSTVDPDETVVDTKDSHKQEININAWSWGMSQKAQLFNTISNVLKTKHDTAKNSIGNVR